MRKDAIFDQEQVMVLPESFGRTSSVAPDSLAA